MKYNVQVLTKIFIFFIWGIHFNFLSGNDFLIQDGDNSFFKKGFVYCKDNFQLHITGHLSLESMYDSRQIQGINLDQYVFYPLPQDCDVCGCDINAKSQFQMLGMRIYVKGQGYGPKIWGAKSYGEIKVDFQGLGDPHATITKLRLGYCKLSWDKSKLFIGQYYNPLALDEIFPDTVTNGFGIGYDPFSRSPQIRFKYKIDKFEYSLAAAKIEWSEIGRWASIPDLFFQANASLGNQLFGGGVYFRSEIPRLETDKKYKSVNQLYSLFPFIFTLLKVKPFDHPFELKARLTYCENGFPFDIMGAYAVKWRNPQTDERYYVNMRALAFWSEFLYKGSKKIEPALLVGYTKNLGAPCNIQKFYVEKNIVDEQEEYEIISLLDVPFAITNAAYMFLIAPRIKIMFGPVRIGWELEYTRAAFARSYDDPNWPCDFDSRGRVVRATPVSNLRFFIETRYYFDQSSFTFI